MSESRREVLTRAAAPAAEPVLDHPPGGRLAAECDEEFLRTVEERRRDLVLGASLGGGELGATSSTPPPAGTETGSTVAQPWSRI